MWRNCHNSPGWCRASNYNNPGSGCFFKNKNNSVPWKKGRYWFSFRPFNLPKWSLSQTHHDCSWYSGHDWSDRWICQKWNTYCFKPWTLHNLSLLECQSYSRVSSDPKYINMEMLTFEPIVWNRKLNQWSWFYSKISQHFSGLSSRNQLCTSLIRRSPRSIYSRSPSKP